MRNAGVRKCALQRLGLVPGPGEREDLGWWCAAGQRDADLGSDPVCLGELVRNALTRTWPAGPRIAISAFGARRSLWLTQRTAASRIMPLLATVRRIATGAGSRSTGQQKSNTVWSSVAGPTRSANCTGSAPAVVRSLTSSRSSTVVWSRENAASSAATN